MYVTQVSAGQSYGVDACNIHINPDTQVQIHTPYRPTQISHPDTHTDLCHTKMHTTKRPKPHIHTEKGPRQDLWLGLPSPGALLPHCLNTPGLMSCPSCWLVGPTQGGTLMGELRCPGQGARDHAGGVCSPMPAGHLAWPPEGQTAVRNQPVLHPHGS